jgi:hypothetical protein
MKAMLQPPWTWQKIALLLGAVFCVAVIASIVADLLNPYQSYARSNGLSVSQCEEIRAMLGAAETAREVCTQRVPHKRFWE